LCSEFSLYCVRIAVCLVVLGTGTNIAEATSVEMREVIDQNTVSYNVTNAEGVGECPRRDTACPERLAVQNALSNALVFAAMAQTGDPDQKERIRGYVESHLAELNNLGDAGRITRRTWGDNGPRINMIVTVQTSQLRRQLEGAGVMASDQDLASAVGNPRIMVINSAFNRSSGSSQTELTNLGDIVADSITSFFTGRRWEMIDRRAMEAATASQGALQGLEGLPTDPAAQLALATGADIYVEFTVETSRGGGKQATVSIKAFDTASAQLLGVQTASSRQYLASESWANVINDASQDALPVLFEQINGYWNQAAQEGRRYKIVVRGDFSDRSQYRAVRDTLKDLGDWRRDFAGSESIVGVLLSTEQDQDDIIDDLEDGLNMSGFNTVRFLAESRNLLMLEVLAD
jgi:hypothetical protein